MMLLRHNPDRVYRIVSKSCCEFKRRAILRQIRKRRAMSLTACVSTSIML